MQGMQRVTYRSLSYLPSRPNSAFTACCSLVTTAGRSECDSVGIVTVIRAGQTERRQTGTAGRCTRSEGVASCSTARSTWAKRVPCHYFLCNDPGQVTCRVSENLTGTESNASTPTPRGTSTTTAPESESQPPGLSCSTRVWYPWGTAARPRSGRRRRTRCKMRRVRTTRRTWRLRKLPCLRMASCSAAGARCSEQSTRTTHCT